MKRTRVHLGAAAAIVAAALTCVSGCSAPDGGSADAKPSGSAEAAADKADKTVAREPQACRGGTYTWFNMQDRSVLNGLADPQRVARGSGKMTKLTEPVRRLRTDQASVVSQGPSLDPKQVLFALSTHLGFTEKGDDPDMGSGLSEPGEYAEIDPGGGEASGSHRTVRLISYSFVRLVETDFRYTCGSGEGRRTTTGHVVTWPSSGGGLISCEEPLDKKASAAAHEAFRLSCPA
ncbi:hypothetical protein [Streptomyces sp. SID7909]|uniref:hypothetical protein n=1 Tax=Streptomyces sp. SID7909 TaxID=2706092 RepID=UPI001EF2DC01|nr:hypothetical protein [Streptomyces sp. SID7909]